MAPRGHALECRLYAEDPQNDDLPSPGRVLHLSEPEGPGIRVDSGLVAGSEVSVHYDPLLSKIITWGQDRPEAIERMRDALRRTVVLGVVTNLARLRAIVEHPAFAAGELHTGFIEEHLSELVPSACPPLEAIAAAAAALRRRPSASDGALRSAPDPWATLGAWRRARSADAPELRGPELRGRGPGRGGRGSRSASRAAPSASLSIPWGRASSRSGRGLAPGRSTWSGTERPSTSPGAESPTPSWRSARAREPRAGTTRARSRPRCRAGWWRCGSRPASAWRRGRSCGRPPLLDGVAYTLAEEREGARAARLHDPGALEAPMRAGVAAVRVTAGQRVAKGERVSSSSRP